MTPYGSQLLMATPHTPAESLRFDAVMQRDAQWDGSFVFAVTSTRIFCRPSCPSRRPRADRLRFFDTPGEARAAGFRACKRCHPDDAAAPSPVQRHVAKAASMLHQDPNWSLTELANETGISAAYLQRSFVRILGVSPLDYANAQRANRLRQTLASSTSVSAAAFDAGFESLNSAYATAEKHLGMTPGDYRRRGVGKAVRYCTANCELGAVLVAATNVGVCRVILGDEREELIEILRTEYAEATFVEDDEMLRDALTAVIDVATGKALSKDVPLDLRGTAFQLRVWQELRRIAKGDTVSYLELAVTVGKPGAVRAVGSACGANPVALLVPCHRVVRSDGALGGYRWGVERKARLLERERKGR